MSQTSLVPAALDANLSVVASSWSGESLPEPLPANPRRNSEEVESRATDSTLDLLSQLASAADLSAGCQGLVGSMKNVVHCDRVAVALASGGSKTCRLVALTGAARFDKHSDLVRAIEAACDESLARGTLAAYPAGAEAERGSTLALKRLCAVAECEAAVTAPLGDGQGKLAGALVLLGSRGEVSSPDAVQFLRTCGTPLGSGLQVLQRAERGPISRIIRSLVENRKSWRVKAALAGGLLFAIILATPLPYKVSCECKLQPVLRRYVAAPFEGVLEKSFVAPGDLVSAGDVLARLDGREIRWELAGVTAEYNRASKQSDSARAVHNVAASQQARLEMERLDLKIRLLKDKSQNLEVKSPLTGIVVGGDLEKAEGAPLAVGQTMFEVAPLDRMRVELSVPEEDVAHVSEGAEVRVQLDAYGSQRWTGQIARLHPRSELRDERNVFIAELTFENPDGRLRPGLKGTAKIIGPRRPLAWNLFHKAWERLLAAGGW